jgi:hypothetical protein
LLPRETQGFLLLLRILTPGKEPQEPLNRRLRATELGWTLQRGEKYLTPAWNRTPIPHHLVVRVPGYRPRGPGFDSWRYQILWVVGLELGPLSLASTIEELLGRKSSVSGLENLEYGSGDPLRWPRDSLYPQNLAQISPTSGIRSVGIVRSRTQATEFSFKIETSIGRFRTSSSRSLTPLELCVCKGRLHVLISATKTITVCRIRHSTSSVYRLAKQYDVIYKQKSEAADSCILRLQYCTASSLLLCVCASLVSNHYVTQTDNGGPIHHDVAPPIRVIILCHTPTQQLRGDPRYVWISIICERQESVDSMHDFYSRYSGTGNNLDVKKIHRVR